MSNSLSPQLIAQLMGQSSSDPYLLLVTFEHESFPAVRVVNNSEDIVSRGDTFLAFPISVQLPSDDGESQRRVALEMDNVSRFMMDQVRSVVTPIRVKLEMILASIPDVVQMSLEELQVQKINYNKSKVSMDLVLDNFLNVEMTSERYTPNNYPGLF